MYCAGWVPMSGGGVRKKVGVKLKVKFFRQSGNSSR